MSFVPKRETRAAGMSGLYDKKGHRKYLTPNKRETFPNGANDAKREARTFCATLAYTGCRISEAIALTAEPVDLKDGKLILDSLKKRRRGIYRPVPPALIDALNMVHDIRAAQKRRDRDAVDKLYRSVAFTGGSGPRGTSFRPLREAGCASGRGNLSANPPTTETDVNKETVLMADINLTQDEADTLMAMEKRAADEKEWLFPSPGERIAIPLTSLDKRENFMLDVTRARIELTKATYQDRARAAIIHLRLDLDGPPHTNPDGAEVPCPHLHIYREGFGDKWAIPAPLTHTRIRSTCFPHSRRSCSTAILRNGPAFRRVYSHDDTPRNREASERLPHVAERQNHAARSG